jgi:hypothetical protein
MYENGEEIIKSSRIKIGFWACFSGWVVYLAYPVYSNRDHGKYIFSILDWRGVVSIRCAATYCADNEIF